MTTKFPALLSFGLMLAGAAPCFAADAPQAQTQTAPAAKKSEPAAKKNAPAAKKTVTVRAVRIRPAAKGGSLLDAIAGALGGSPDAAKGDNGEDPRVRQIETQLRPQFEQLLYSELAFLRRAGKPDAKMFLEIAKAAKAKVRVPLRQYIAATYGMAVKGAQKNDNSELAMQDLLADLAAAKLGPEKIKLYREECKKRTAAHQRAVAMNVVAAIDERLTLTAEQRAKLTDSLSSKYDGSWDSYCQYYAFNGQYLPTLPDTAILPLLDEKQKGVWQEISKMNGQIHFGRVVCQNQFGQTSGENQEIAHMVEEVKDEP